MLVTSIFSFSHNVFNPQKDIFNVFSSLELSFPNAFNLDKAKRVGLWSLVPYSVE